MVPKNHLKRVPSNTYSTHLRWGQQSHQRTGGQSQHCNMVQAMEDYEPEDIRRMSSRLRRTNKTDALAGPYTSIGVPCSPFKVTVPTSNTPMFISPSLATKPTPLTPLPTEINVDLPSSYSNLRNRIPTRIAP